MPIVEMLAAEADVSRLIEQIESGAEREIIIARNGKPVARIVPLEPAGQGDRPLGLFEGQYPTCSQEEFDETNDLIAALFHGEA